MFQKNIFDEEKKKTRNVDLTAFLVFLCLTTAIFCTDVPVTPYTITSQEEYEIIQSLHNLTQNDLKEISNLVLKFQKRDWDIF